MLFSLFYLYIFWRIYSFIAGKLLAASPSMFGVETHKLATKESVDQPLTALKGQLESLPVDAPVIMFGLASSTFIL
jgi:hypothetical protein